MPQFSSNFPGGNATSFRHIGPDHYSFEVELHGGEHGIWFHFRVDGAEGRQLVFDIRNAEALLGIQGYYAATHPIVGRPGQWRRCPSSVEVFPDHSLARLHVEVDQDPMWVAFCYPYALRELDQFRERLFSEESPSLREECIGESPMGHPVYVWQIGKGPRGIWLTARTHASESPPSFVLEGLVAEALGPQSRDLLGDATFHVCPMVDVDNVQSGAYGKFGPPCDPWMDWSDRPIHHSVAALQDYFGGAPEAPALCLDLHSPLAGHPTFGVIFDEGEAPPEQVSAARDFCRVLHEETPHPLKLDLPSTRGYPGWYNGRPAESAPGYFRARYACTAMTLEVAYHVASRGDLPTEADYRNFGRALCRAIGKWLESQSC